MGRRVDEWEECKRRRRMDQLQRQARYGSVDAKAKLDAQIDEEREKTRVAQQQATENPLGRTPAEVEEMYREARIERTLTW